ncbi:MAG TPA: type II toxin-antitoxin system VapC family toxin [Herpetosiphonaceae bacterium]|jgi:predicted nucleic acid-binding protein|nr:type II toxin-antitoxin system VapC family toxin [Herpetosiphonaceae bacterium]
MTLVLDSSVTLAWVYADEVTPAIEQVFKRIADTQAWVPAIWPAEVANGLQSGIRRGRIDVAFRDAALADLAVRAIVTDADTNTYVWTTTVRLATRFGLTIYDTLYLELAQRRGLPLASLDNQLRSAATSLGIDVLGI